jgi:predicted DNA-binding transcriptional regulator AlpA
MKMVLTRPQVAKALELSVTELDILMPDLYSAGFPRPIESLSDRWSLIQVMNWVNRQISDVKSTATAQISYINPAAKRFQLF